MPPLSSKENENRRMFVGHLNPITEDRKLQDYFSSFGEILDFVIMRYPDSKKSKCFGFITFSDPQSLEQALNTQPHYLDGSPLELKKAVPKEELEKKPRSGPSGGGGGGGRLSNTAGRLFVGRLNYDTNDTVLRSYFEKFGELTDYIIMRYPDTKRSKGFGFVTFRNPENMEECINSQPHTIDGKEVELQRATPREETGGGTAKMGSRGISEDLPTEPLDPEHKLLRKLFIGNLNYLTTEQDLRQHFERFGRLEECSLMKFNDTGRSRGFAFLTYEKAFMVDDCQCSRPHEIGGKVLEVKRAAPKTNSRDPEALANVKKLWVGGFDDNMSDDDIREYFEQYGNVESVEQVKWHDSGKKRGFGFVEFDDHDAVDKIILIGYHSLKGKQLEVKKALSKQEIAAIKEQQQKSKVDAWSSGDDNSFSSGFGGSSSFGGNSGFGNSFMNNMGMMDMMMGMGSSGSGNKGFGSMGGGYMSSSAGSGRQDDFGDARRMGRPGASAGYSTNPSNEPVISSNMEKIIMQKMNAIYENMSAITNMAGMMGSMAARGGGNFGNNAGGSGGGPMRGGTSYSGGARESAGPYARTSDASKKHYGW